MDLFSQPPTEDEFVIDAKSILQLNLNLLDETQIYLLYQKLIALIKHFDNLYYVKAESNLTDFEYDKLFSILKEIESLYPKFITPTSPSQTISENLSNEFNTVEHLTPMMSLENSYNAEDLIAFDKRIKDALPMNSSIEYIVEPKFDGSSIALVYENNKLVRAATRGNGIAGDEITNNALQIKNIPNYVDFKKYGIKKIEIRGEVVINNSNFEQLNKEREQQNEILKQQGKKELEYFKNSRNTAAGALRLKDPKEIAAKRLEAILYNIGFIDNTIFKSHHETLETLDKLGFSTAIKDIGKFNNIDDVINWCRAWEEKRDNYPTEIDGMVIKVNLLQHQSLIGKTSHHPKWAIAYKFKARQAKSVLLRVEYQVGRTGVVTPVAKIQPVQLAGVEIGSVSLHNEDFIIDKDIHIGDTLVVERSGDVIPYIAGVCLDLRPIEALKVCFPLTCPSCSHKLHKINEESAWRCISTVCPAQIEEHIIHFVSKDAMEISGMGEEIVRKFIRQDILKTIEDIYSIDFQKVSKLEGWKEKSIENLKNNIEISKNQPVYRLLVGLGIRHVGVTMSKQIVKHINKLTDFGTWTLEEYIALEDIGPKVAQSLYDFFNDKENIQLINNLATLGVNINQEHLVLESNKLEGKTFLFTGTLSRISRDDAKTLVESHGGKYLSGVSANLDYLIAGEKAGSKLSKAQKIDSINIIDEETFFKMLN